MPPRLPALALISMLSFTAVGCADDIGTPLEQPGDKADDADPLVQELTEKYGLRPRRYAGFYNDSNEAERRFTARLPLVTDELNARGVELGYPVDFTEAELAINFITEGGYFLLDSDFTDSDYDAGIYIDGFTYLGVDTFADNLDALAPWFTAEIERAFNAGEIGTFEAENELGQTVNSIVVQTIEQGLEVNAIVFAWSRSMLMNDLAENSETLAGLDAEARFFWSTMYYNAGTGFGRARLREHGSDYWQVKWTGPDDHATQSRYARYNAFWRTSSLEYLTRTTYAQ